MRLGGKALVLGGLAVGAQASLHITPGATWTAANTGRHVQAHGPGIIAVGNTYYLIGEDKTDGSSFQNINCYSSSNLVEWNFVGALLSRGSSGDLGPSRVVERPKVIFNKSTNQYVMYMHIDSSDYKEAKVGVATSSSVCGKYTYRNSFRPLNFESRDMGLWQEADGTAYLLTEDRANGLRINRLSSDYLSVASNVYTFPEKYESPAMYKDASGRYFLFASKLTGWDPNDNIYNTATSLSGPWSGWKTFADVGSNTYASQASYILPLPNGNAMYLGDRWVSSNLMRSTYIWLPLKFSGSTVSMKNAASGSWIPDLSSGTERTPPSESTIEGESAALSGGAKAVSCSNCSGSKAAGYIGSASSGAGGIAVFSNVKSNTATRTTVRFRHKNGDSSERYAEVKVNGVSAGRFAFLPGDLGTSAVHLALKAGTNEMTVQGINGWGPDLDSIIVPSE